MIFGAHVTLYSTDAAADRAFLAEVLGSAVETARWGSLTRLKLPGGGEVGLYRPTHALALTRAAVQETT